MKHFLTSILFLLCAGTVNAEYKFVVPQAAGNGTAVWAEIIAKHLEKKLGERIVIQYIPGAKDISGFNDFHNKLRLDEKTMMVSHGGNAISYLVDKVDYDYRDYDSIGMMNLNIVVAKRKNEDFNSSKIKIAGSSGTEADGMAIALLVCGNLNSMEQYLDCWNQKVIWVNGVKGNERRLGFKRGEFNVARENTTAWKKHYKDDPEVEVWFHHGVFDLSTRSQKEDSNYDPGYQFETVFEKTHKTKPTGPLYEAYRLSRNFRDVLQKAIWINKNNPNRNKIVEALKEMIKDPEAISALEKDTGKYNWIVSDQGNQVVTTLRSNMKDSDLKNIVWWHQNAYKFPSVYKPELLKN